MKFGGGKRRSRLVTEAQQSFSFTRRTFTLGAIQGGIGLMLAGRMAWLAIGEHDHFDMLAESNRARSTLIPPRRGWIVDRHGKPIAVNRSDFRVDLIPDLMRDKDAEIA
ncbi:MAG: penicillin-binding protein 2, partial [Sphingomonas bacterium]|nr:penicillin-binding protein 2 [Sphingomonas bacterium]